ncbi:SDR family NAD(P)-dependent oxidoreductase [Nioella nitratireducens]|uniref:SDR family NAD(P)-dependent oxidoreductase n=1 Tax=Nioella nitratireducens TaxID=1287720 RepID=UPI0008FD89B7|nr:SDR family NAD(P)-dependent oxidoreductase [Nioella nitratireducens]
MDIAQAKVIVTGGASGLGAATATHFAEAGAKVTIFDRDAVRGGDMAQTPDISFAEVDVTSEDSVAAGVALAVAAMGGITAVVNCAGIVTGAKTVGSKGPFPLDAFQRTIDINLVGAFNVARLAAVEMAKNDPDADGERGAIVNTASVAAFDGQKGQAAYSASKAGIAGLSLPMARDMGTLGIRVNAIAPGLFLTPMLESLGPEMMEELAKDVIFPRRLGRPEEFARMARFMVEMPYLNGETVRLDGALRLP